MSQSYEDMLYHPMECVIRKALILPDHFNKYQDGVKFYDDNQIYQLAHCAIPINTDCWIRAPQAFKKSKVVPTPPKKPSHLSAVPNVSKILHSWLL